MAPEILINMEKFEQLLPSAEYSDSDNSKIIPTIYNKKIDLWSYGICLYELLFNILPFSNMSDINDLKIFYSNKLTQSLIFKNIQDKITISNETKHILKKLLTIDPKERITTDELFDLVHSLPDTEIHDVKQKRGESVKGNNINMDSWLVEDIHESESNWDKVDDIKDNKDFKNLTLSVDNNFIKWLGLKDAKQS